MTMNYRICNIGETRTPNLEPPPKPQQRGFDPPEVSSIYSYATYENITNTGRRSLQINVAYSYVIIINILMPWLIEWFYTAESPISTP